MMTDEVRKDVMAKKILDEPTDYRVCVRCGAINQKSDKSICWRCEYEDFHNDVEQGIEDLKNDEWNFDFETEDWMYRYVDVVVVEEEKDKND